jgi:hypothetical protein
MEHYNRLFSEKRVWHTVSATRVYTVHILCITTASVIDLTTWTFNDLLQKRTIQNKLISIHTGWMAGVRFPARARDFYFLHRFQIESAAHPASYSVGTGGSFPGGKAAGA